MKKNSAEFSMNEGHVLVAIFGFIDAVMLTAVLVNFSAWTALGFGFTSGLLFAQIVETFHERRYEVRFRNDGGY